MKNFDEITVVWTVGGEPSMLMDRIKKNHVYISNIIVVCPDSFSFHDDYALQFVKYSPQEGLVSALNRAIDLVETPWILYLDDQEQPELESILAITLEEDKIYAGLIESYEPFPVKKQQYQIRLFPNNKEIRFSGYNVPYLRADFLLDNREIFEKIFFITKMGPNSKIADTDTELEEAPNTAYPNLLTAIRYSADGDHKKAISFFRKALKSNQLMTFDFTAALNGLSNSLAETNRWEESRLLTERSLGLNAGQKMPYLVLYKIAQFNKNWGKACDHLGNYYQHYNSLSHTNFDVTLPKVDFHFLMADAAFRSGNYRKAFEHYEEYYELNDGRIGDDLLERMFIYSVELSDYDKSKRYFMDLFERYLPGHFDEKTYLLMNEALSLFVDKGWIDFACRIYEKIYNVNPDDDVVLHRWVAALIKAKEIKKARFLISKSNKHQMAMVGK